MELLDDHCSKVMIAGFHGFPLLFAHRTPFRSEPGRVEINPLITTNRGFAGVVGV